MNKRGIALIVAFMVVVVLTTLGTATVSRSVSERFIAQRNTESMQAFWLAEAAVAEALLQLKNDFNDLNSISATNLGNGQYSVDGITEEGSNRRATVHGFVPSQASPRAERTITILVQSLEGSNPSNPELIQYAVDTTGSLDISGNAKIVPPESNHQNSQLDFEEVFGTTKEAIKAIADQAAVEGNGYVYTNPGTNQLPVEGITWVTLTGNNKFEVSGQWSGSGLLIIDGNGQDVALQVGGGGDMTFTGMIWVMGKVKIAGSATISGAIFAESMTGIQSDVTGNSTITFSIPSVEGAFGLLGGGSGGLEILSWREL